MAAGRNRRQAHLPGTAWLGTDAYMLRHDNATHLPRARGGLERRIRDAETHLFDAVGADVDQFFLDLARTRLRLRVIAHGRGPTVLLLHGVSESAAVWAPLFPKLRHLRVLAVDLPGHGLSDPISFQPGKVRQTARSIVDDILDALQIDHVPVIGHSLGGMFALWHLAAGSTRISELVAIGAPAVALEGTRVRIPLSLLTVRGLGVAVLRAPSPPGVYRRLLARGLGTSDVAAAPGPLIEALSLSARRPDNARTVASLMHGMNRFRRARPESVLSRPEARLDQDTHNVHPRTRRPLLDRLRGEALGRSDTRRQTTSRCPADTPPGSQIPKARRS